LAIAARESVLRDPGLMDGLEEKEVVIDHVAEPPPEEGKYLLSNSYGVYGKMGEWTWEEKDFAIFTRRSHAEYMLLAVAQDPAAPEWHKRGLRVDHIGEFYGGSPEDWDAEQEYHKLN
jgi:hypothetical protein